MGNQLMCRSWDFLRLDPTLPFQSMSSPSSLCLVRSVLASSFSFKLTMKGKFGTTTQI